MDLLSVFELYSGIGGMHFSLKETNIPAKVVRAVDINPIANSVYKLNFPDTVHLEKNAQSLDENDFNNLDIDMIMMSPPCQPFTRNGLKKDLEDHRNFSILHMVNLIPKLKTVKYVLLENVVGFEISDVRNKLVMKLIESNFVYQEFLLSPNQFSIPNSRLRYYLLAKRAPLEFCFVKKNEIFYNIPQLKPEIDKKLKEMNEKYKKQARDQPCFQIRLVLKETSDHLVEDNVLAKYGSLLDIVTKESIRSCCFTKSYGRYVEGTGSVFTPAPANCVSEVFKELEVLEKGSEEYVNLIKTLRLRYFSPEEVSSLMAFPDNLKFPTELSNKQMYRLLGNSINVHVVAILTVLLVS